MSLWGGDQGNAEHHQLLLLCGLRGVMVFRVLCDVGVNMDFRSFNPLPVLNFHPLAIRSHCFHGDVLSFIGICSPFVVCATARGLNMSGPSCRKGMGLRTRSLQRVHLAL